MFLECQRVCIRVDVHSSQIYNLVFLDHEEFHDPIKFMSEINKQIKVRPMIHNNKERKILSNYLILVYINIYQKNNYSKIFLIIRGSLLLSTIKFPKNFTRSMSKHYNKR